MKQFEIFEEALKKEGFVVISKLTWDNAINTIAYWEERFESREKELIKQRDNWKNKYTKMKEERDHLITY